jgi:hypothetical protein
MARSSALTRLLTASLAAMLGVFLLSSSTTAFADSRDGLTVLAQVQQRSIQRLTAPGKGKRVDCNGKTATECCKGISYCGCMYPPLGGSNPFACFSSPPPSKPKG